jgi:uncharacterized phage protein (TIGR02218 family)
MRTASVQLQARIAAESTTLARLWRVTRSDGEVLRFTDAVRPITIEVAPDTDPEVYRSDITFTSSAIFTSSSYANQQSVTIDIAMDDAGFSEGDLRARKYDGALSELMVVDYEFPEYGAVPMFAGIFGTITLSDQGMAQIEIQPSDAAINGQAIGLEKYSQTCRANLGDTRCKVDIEALKVAFTVDTASGGSLVASELTQASGAWALGFVRWLTGENAGKTSMVTSNDQGTTSLFLASPPFYPIAVGDTGEVLPGCDKLRVTCMTKFNNLANMRAEPDVPELAGVGRPFSVPSIAGLGA